jgi:nucleotide-binding universal stress UspA family protein
MNVQFERAFDGILSFSKENKTDLIVMGSHGTWNRRSTHRIQHRKVVRLSEVTRS